MTARLLFGAARTAELVRFAEAAVEMVEGLPREHAIDCDYVPAGNVMAAVHPVHEKRLRKAVDAAVRVGAHVRFLDRAEMHRRGLPPAVLGLLRPATLADLETCGRGTSSRTSSRPIRTTTGTGRSSSSACRTGASS